MTIKEAIEIALKECKDPYAQSYLHALDKARADYGEEGVRVQILYVLNNMSMWRGEQAREVKKVMRAFAKDESKSVRSDANARLLGSKIVF